MPIMNKYIYIFIICPSLPDPLPSIRVSVTTNDWFTSNTPHCIATIKVTTPLSSFTEVLLLLNPTVKAGEE